MATRRQLVPPSLPVLVVVLLGTLSARADQHVDIPSEPPTFADNYVVQGRLSLPYAELNEPFTAYYDKPRQRSRVDYYDNEYQVYQFGPTSAPDQSGGASYGATYQFLYVPADFGSPSSMLAGQQKESIHGQQQQQQQQQRVTDGSSDASVKRVCFGSLGSVGNTVSAQTVLPDLSDFSYDSTGRCPHTAAGEHRHSKCELWKRTTVVGDKKNVYKFWVKREPERHRYVPVYYYMLGYDTLLGSHYDRYDISYNNFKFNGSRDDDFLLDAQKCGPMPGPGDSSADSDSGRRAQMVVQNPIHQYVVEPHRYDHIDHHFEKFKSEYEQFTRGKYADEQQERKGWFNFLHNLRFIHGHNRQRKPYKLAVNQFADENVSSLRYLRGRLHTKPGVYNGGLDYAQHHPGLLSSSGRADPLPETFDWTTVGAVTPVKDQAVCGSCWSFGTTGAVEGAYFVKTGKLLRLSQQQLVDCSWKYGNNGCDGGEDWRAYKYIMDAGGLATEEDYGHYKAIDGMCHDKKVDKQVKIKGFYNVTANSVDALKHALVNYGPVSISIDASPQTFSFYSHGAYSDEKCRNSPDNLDHAVLAVGYTTLNGKLVWKVKNSWSTYWGNNGYIFIAAENNICGVLDDPTVPIVDVPTQSSFH